MDHFIEQLQNIAGIIAVIGPIIFGPITILTLLPNWVQLLDIVDNSISLCKHTSSGFFVMVQTEEAIFSWSEPPSNFFCWHFHQSLHDMTLQLHLAGVALKRKLAAVGK